jgi:hypothetical protein
MDSARNPILKSPFCQKPISNELYRVRPSAPVQKEEKRKRRKGERKRKRKKKIIALKHSFSCLPNWGSKTG